MLWKQRRWVALIDYINLLQQSSTSRLRSAMLDDPEVVEQILAQPESGEPSDWSPPLTEWDTGAALQAETRDLLMDIVRLLAAIRGGIPVVQQEKLKPLPKTGGKPFPRPKTELDRARQRAETQAYINALAVFSPHALN